MISSWAQADERIEAQNYQQFWLWGGVKPRLYLEEAQCLYLLQGEIAPTSQGQVQLTAQSMSTPGPHKPPLYLVYRLRTLELTPQTYAMIRARLARWQAQEGKIEGIQIDFDASTRNLSQYAEFLRHLRKELPADAKISVTGLMDWASQSNLDDLNSLSGAVDEIIFQTYRGRTTVSAIDDYIARLPRLKIPFKLGLVEGGNWPPAPQLSQNPHFRGFVVFLLNRPAGR